MREKIEDKVFIYDQPNNKRFALNIFIKKIYLSYIKLRLTFVKKKNGNKKYNVTICSIFKNEAKYLKEWIEYHRIIGIDHFFMYNNNSEDDYMKVLKPYIDEGIVELENWEKNQAQMECYQYCISKHRQDAKWIGFIDIDEFVNPIKYDNIGEFLEKYEKNRGSVLIYWKMFGTSGNISRANDGLVTNDFIVSWPKLVNIGKCFYNTKFELDNKKISGLHHRFWTKYKIYSIPPVNQFNKFSLPKINKGNINTEIQINHYFTKTYEEYLEKKSKGDVFYKINPHDEEYFYFHEMKCTSCDYSIYKYLIKLKRKMKESNNNE